MSNLTSLVGIGIQHEFIGKKKEVPNYEKVLQDFLHDTIIELKIPPYFKINELVDFLTSRFFQLLEEKDPEFLRILKDLGDYEMIPTAPEELRDFAKLFSKFNNKIKDYSARALSIWSVYFYISDLPLSLFNEFSLLVETDRDFVDYIVRFSKQLSWRARTIRYASLERQIKDFSSNIDTVGGSAIEAKKSYLKLFLFIQIQNASNYDNLFEIRPLSREKLDSSHFRRLEHEFSKNLYGYRRKLESISPVVFQQKVDKQTALLWSALSSPA